MSRAVVVLTMFFALLPALALAQQPDPRPCPTGPQECWWQAGPVAQLDQLDVRTNVRDASSSADYTFSLSNSSRGGVAEGRIIIPVPRGSAVTGLTLSGGPETLEGALIDAKDASRIYQEIVRRRIDPALLQSVGSNLYEVRAFPVPAGEGRQVSFTVTSPLTAEGEAAALAVPWSRMSPRPLKASFRANVNVSWGVRSAIAPSHPVIIDREGPGKAKLSWESGTGWKAESDFTLYLGGGKGVLDSRMLAYRERGENGYFALLFAPQLETTSRVDRDLIAVLDVSGSMRGEKLSQAKDALTNLVEGLGPGDRFGIVTFSDGVSIYGNRLHPARDRRDGIDYIQGLQVLGGTNIAGALSAGFDLATGSRPATIIFLTDGLPTVGARDVPAIMRIAREHNDTNAQLFAFGVGNDVDTILLDALATEFTGTSHFVRPGQDIEAEVSRLYERISTPILTSVEVTIDGKVSQVAPRTLTGIFAGSQALVTGRYGVGGPVTVRVEGDTSQGRKTFEYHLSLPESDLSDPAIARLWAQQRIADLLTELRIEGPSESVVAEIVEIATRFGIVTPYTSYLARETSLVFDSAAARQSVSSYAAAAPSSGATAVAGAASAGELREGKQQTSGQSVRSAGGKSFYLLDGAWVQSGYAPGAHVPGVAVASTEFASLVERAPALLAAAALGERVIADGPDGFVRIEWPSPDSDSFVVPEVSWPGTSPLVPSGPGFLPGPSAGDDSGVLRIDFALAGVLGLLAMLSAGAVIIGRRSHRLGAA